MNEENNITVFVDDGSIYMDLFPGTVCLKNRGLSERIIAMLNRDRSGSNLVSECGFSATTMAAIKEASRIRPAEVPYCDQDISYKGKRIKLEGVKSNLPDISISETFRKRRSYRNFGRIHFFSLSNLLFHGGRVRDVWEAPDGYRATSRPSPSAGGRHPIDLLCVANDVEGLKEGIYVFDPFVCDLIEIPNSEKAQEELTMEAFVRLGENDIPPLAIFFVAQLHKTFSRYPGGITFIYRDSGALLATLSLVATSLGLYSCGIGSSGMRIVNELMEIPFPKAVEVGGIAVGGKPNVGKGIV